ncbi:MAG: hypothetical protein AVO33_09580 [delta proteobacterium ML8_F1]|nr:MAG: hypothetical protein AVO33_09580 [delta proteobacterium ML8_F1]
MKSIAIVTDSIYKSNRPHYVGDIIRKNLYEVFKDKIQVRNYFLDQLQEGETVSEDIVLVMAGSRAIKIKDHVPNPDFIFVAKRTFLKRGVYPLFSLPQNTDVLVVNDDIETVLDSVSSLYHIGVKHVNLIPFESHKDYHHIQYAVSPSEMELIPEYIENTFDLGSRVLDIPTMLLIMSTLEIKDKVTQQNLYDYYQKVFSDNEIITENYSNLLTRTEELDYLLDLSHDAIVLTDTSGRILVHNRKFNEIFNITRPVIDETLHELIPEIPLRDCYPQDFHDDLVVFKKKYLNLEKKNLVHFNRELRMYFSFQEVTHIKKLEQNLTQKLRKKGQIAKYTFDDILTDSSEVFQIIEKSKKIAQTDLTVLITGESGTGKEVLAQAIHNSSRRKNQPFIAINGAAIPDNLLESELFGYVSGSFTGALKGGKKGLFELANNGTVFLDEIGDMPNHLQSKLLRVLQERQITPIGSDQIIEIDVRVIAATHKNPQEMIATGSFRTDLFYRLNVFPIELPPLRNRKKDIPLLLEAFTGGKYRFEPESLEKLTQYSWPGNIRELFNIAQYIATIEERDRVDLASLPGYIRLAEDLPPAKAPLSLTRLIEEIVPLQEALTVLKSIATLNRIKKTAGRKHLGEFVQKQGLSLSENSLKKILLTLADHELILIKKGRSGSFITKKGEEFLQNNH